MAASDAGRLSALRRELLRGLVIPAHPLALTESAAARRAPPGRADALLLRRRRRRHRRRRAHDAVRDPRSGDRPVRAGPRARAADGARLVRGPTRTAGHDRGRGRTDGAGGARGGAGGVARLRCGAAEPCGASRRGQSTRPRSLPPRRRHHSRRRVLPAARRRRTRPRSRLLARFFDIERVVAIKVAPFDRYRTLDVTTALAESGRDDVALYTGNDDAIVADLLTPFPAGGDGAAAAFLGRPARPVGGLDESAPSSCCAAAMPSRRAVRPSDGAAAAAGARRRADRRQRRAVRSRAPVRRLHPRHSRSPAPPGAARRALVPRSARGAEPGTDGRDRPRARALSASDRRRVREGESGSLAAVSTTVSTSEFFLLHVGVDRHDRTVVSILQLHHLDVAQVGLTARELCVVVEEIPAALELDDRVVVGPPEDGLENPAAIGEGAVRERPVAYTMKCVSPVEYEK